jgi:hypothetical protein
VKLRLGSVPPLRSVPLSVCCALLGLSLAANGELSAAAKGEQSAQPALSGEQQRAAGIVVAHPIAAQAPERIEALGLVLDTTALISDLGDTTAADAAERAGSAELARLRALYAGGAGVSLKMLEAAQAEQAKAQAQAQAAASRFGLRWGPLAALPAEARQKAIQASTSGRSLLLRADLPGRHAFGVPPSKAMVDVDGIQVPGRVLGILRETTELQSVGLLIEVPDAPGGLGPGARVPVALFAAERKGLLLPRDALLYDENGAYVYKQLGKETEGQKTEGQKTRYAAVKVRLVLPYGDGWLVEGVDDDDTVVVHGAGVLWSLQGVGVQQSEDDDD